MSFVCVIDDDPSVLKATSRLLRAAGFEVRPFASAQAYLAQFDAEAPGCLVLDLNMPAVNGLQLQKTLAERDGAPAIIFLSGHADVPKSVQAMKGDAVDFLGKPVDAAALIRAVHAALETDRSRRKVRAGRVMEKMQVDSVAALVQAAARVDIA